MLPWRLKLGPYLSIERKNPLLNHHRPSESIALLTSVVICLPTTAYWVSRFERCFISGRVSMANGIWSQLPARLYFSWAVAELIFSKGRCRLYSSSSINCKSLWRKENLETLLLRILIDIEIIKKLCFSILSFNLIFCCCSTIDIYLTIKNGNNDITIFPVFSSTQSARLIYLENWDLPIFSFLLNSSNKFAIMMALISYNVWNRGPLVTRRSEEELLLIVPSIWRCCTTARKFKHCMILAQHNSIIFKVLGYQKVNFKIWLQWKSFKTFSSMNY